MADFNISANDNVNPRSRNYPSRPASISFQAAQACVVTFTPSTGNCFDVPSVSLAGGPADVNLTVVSSVQTQGSVTAPLRADGFQQNPDIFEITFGTNQ